ncbi:CBU_0592 family membrane protein [Propionibacterium sp.]|uniref:CBU_0592 family membrane protein n=1 Tax=Propionibacterium sp. TaxID=1977903 RepID=UPI0039EAD14E
MVVVQGMTTMITMVLGYLGAAGTVAAYCLVSGKRIRPDSLRFHALNMISCLFLAIACITTRAWPSLITNSIFLLVGLHMVWQLRDRVIARLHHIHAGQVRNPENRARTEVNGL